MATESARRDQRGSVQLSPVFGSSLYPQSHTQNVLWRLQAALDTLPDAVFFVDHLSLAIIDVNQAACTTLGYSREQLLAMRLPQIASLVDRRELAAELDTLARQRERGKPLRTVQHSRDGRKQPVEWTISWASQSYGGVFVVVSRPSTVPAPGAIAMESEVSLDSLTGLPERRSFDRRLAEALKQAQRQEGYAFAVFFLDLDHFKQVNDRFGHQCGDRLLSEVAQRLATCVRPGDMVARRGGDEFTVLVDHLRDRQDAIGVAERMQAQLRSPLELEGQAVSITSSIGIAFSTRGYSHPDDLIRDADRAMYSAKAAGKARYAVFDDKTCSGNFIRAKAAAG